MVAFSAYAPRKDFADPAGVSEPRRNALWRLHDAMGRRDGLQRGVARLPIKFNLKAKDGTPIASEIQHTINAIL